MIDFKSFMIIFVLFSAAFFLNSCEAALCVKQNSCVCQIDEDKKIDISNLITGHNHYLEDFKDNVTYYFSGCEDAEINVLVNSKSGDYTPMTKTVTASLLLYDNGTNNYVVLGYANQIRFNKNAENSEQQKAENNYEIVYINENLTSTIKLICDGFNIPIFKTIEARSYQFALASPKACLIVEDAGMSGGSKFLIFLLVIISVYFIGGGLILYFIRGARGLEMVPNLDFWRNLPGLVKDGVIFLLSGCRPTVITSAETYDRI